MANCQRVVRPMCWSGKVRPADAPCTCLGVAVVADHNHPEGVLVCKEHLKKWAVLHRPLKCAKCGQALGKSRDDFYDEQWPYRAKIKEVLHLICFNCHTKMIMAVMKSETSAMFSVELPDEMLGVDGDGHLSLGIPITPGR